MKALELLDRYVTEGSPTIDGWVEPDIWPLVATLHALQTELQVAGPALEIGVHHGKFLLGLEQLIDQGEKVIGIDIFGNQHLNVDASGSGDRQAFDANVAKYAANPDRVLAWSADSMALGAAEVLRAASDRRFRLISIDGGHTPEHTQSDLGLAEQMLAPGGLVFLDDYYNADWPGVHEGFIRYLWSAPRLVPLATYANKMILCSLSWQRVLSGNLGRAAQFLGKQINGKGVSLSRHAYFNIHNCVEAKR